MINVLVVDDSPIVRKLLEQGLVADPQVNVISTAANAYQARDLVVRDDPDVMVLDLGLTRIDGLAFLKQVMRHHPLPTVVISEGDELGAKRAMRALDLGAVDALSRGGSITAMTMQMPELVAKVKAASQACMDAEHLKRVSSRGNTSATPLLGHNEVVIAVGSSTGGTDALNEIFRFLPETTPAVLIVQHMPAGFTAALAQRLNKLSAMEVREAQDGDTPLQGLALVCPGDRHMRVVRRNGRLSVSLNEEPPVNRHRPSVDMLFHSVASACGERAVGVILTGMGNDGAAGLLAMRDECADTIAQDEASCVIFGMPREAIALGAVSNVKSLKDIPPAMLLSAIGR